MNESTKYEHLNLQALLDLLDKKYAQLALICNNKFNLEFKCEELNKEVTLLRKEIARKNQAKSQENATAKPEKSEEPSKAKKAIKIVKKAENSRNLSENSQDLPKESPKNSKNSQKTTPKGSNK